MNWENVERALRISTVATCGGAIVIPEVPQLLQALTITFLAILSLKLILMQNNPED